MNGTNKNSSAVSQIKPQLNSTTFGDHVNTINGTGEINYNQTSQSNQNQNGKGPQLTFDKNYLCMKVKVGEIGQDSVVVTNVGSTTVTYMWKKVQRGDYIQSKSSDAVQRFYCHYPRSILKPGESKTFIFSFRSDQKPGIFFEEWEHLTEPLLLQPLPLINLTGMAIQDDLNIQYRESQKHGEEKVQCDIIAKELYEEIFQKMPIKETPPPDLHDPVVFKEHFEKENKHLGLYYTANVMNQLFSLLDDILSRIAPYDKDEYIGRWRGKIEYLEELIQQVPNPYSKEFLKERYVKLLALARKVPIDRAQSYPAFRQLILHNFPDVLVELDQKGREELQMMEHYGFLVPSETQTEEEVKKIEEDKKAKKADWLKKMKKKPKTEEEEHAEIEELKSRIVNGARHEIGSVAKIEKLERQVLFEKQKWLFENHLKMDEGQYDELYRLESILDIDISGKDLILRLDLDVPLSPYVPPQIPSLQQTLDDLQKSQANSRGLKKQTHQQLQQEAIALQQQLQAQSLEDPWKKRDILDHTLIKKAAVDLRYCIEHLANRTFIMGNLNDRAGKIKPENSLKIIYNVLQQQLIEQQIIFINESVIKDFEQKRENEEFPESTTFMLENLNFKPDEFGYVEPDKPPEELKPSEEELKKEEELKQQQLQQAQQKGGAGGKAAPAKPGDKKKQEEEAKKKAEEEAAALALKKKQEEKQISEEERQEQQRLKEEAERKKRELEYFDFRTIHHYKETLGKYGDVYVNDAPLMTLTNSNSIAEIKCKKKVMGLRMTEELRKICLFFLKKHPEDINKLWYNKPQAMEYHQIRLTAVLGGSFHDFQELLDKILMLNSFLDTCKQIHLVGELGLAALFALGIKNVPRVERFSNDAAGRHQQEQEYSQVKGFLQQIFEKAILKQIQLFLPVDFILSPKIDIEDSVDIHDQSISNTQHNTNAQQHQSKTQVDKTQMSKLQMSMSQDDETGKKAGNMPLEKPQWKPYHWADKIVHKEKHRQLDLQILVAIHWSQIADKVWPQYVKENNVETYNDYYTSRNFYNYNELNHKYQGEYEAFQQMTESEQPKFDQDDYILEFGDKTKTAIFDAIEKSFKLLWDGSISPFTSAVLCSITNKEFVSRLLDLRTRTQADDEPPVTLLHGHETETVVRQAIMRIKVEQQESLEAQKRKAKEEGEELEEDEDDVQQITMTQDESKEEASTIQQDMAQIADFLCFEINQFTMKVMQGVPNKSLYNLDQHKKKTPAQEEEDLFLLDEI